MEIVIDDDTGAPVGDETHPEVSKVADRRSVSLSSVIPGLSDSPRKTAKDLVDWLVKRGPGYSAAFEDLSIVRIAVNMEFSDLKHIITNEDEVAFFPPVTGGNRMEKIFD